MYIQVNLNPAFFLIGSSLWGRIIMCKGMWGQDEANMESWLRLGRKGLWLTSIIWETEGFNGMTTLEILQ
jgi:hypothetical protein